MDNHLVQHVTGSEHVTLWKTSQVVNLVNCVAFGKYISEKKYHVLDASYRAG